MSYISIDKEFFEKTKEKAFEREKEQNGEDAKSYLYEDKNLGSETITIDEIQDNGTISFNIINDLGYFSFELPLDDDNLIGIVSIITKRLNKFKSVLESLK
ncbi:MAG: hypothetical protein Q7R52_02965 [archaeon]|nr:hypothetical protein [archaeon]